MEPSASLSIYNSEADLTRRRLTPPSPSPGCGGYVSSAANYAHAEMSQALSVEWPLDLLAFYVGPDGLDSFTQGRFMGLRPRRVCFGQFVEIEKSGVFIINLFFPNLTWFFSNSSVTLFKNRVSIVQNKKKSYS